MEAITQAILALNNGEDTVYLQGLFSDILDKYSSQVDGTLLACTDLYRLCHPRPKEILIDSNQSLIEAVFQASIM
jgi:aspartate/glutamate racemase